MYSSSISVTVVYVYVFLCAYTNVIEICIDAYTYIHISEYMIFFCMCPVLWVWPNYVMYLFTVQKCQTTLALV